MRSGKPKKTTQDGWFAEQTKTGVRVAAIDGVTPHVETRGHAGVDGGAWACGVVATALRTPGDLVAALYGAHKHLWDPKIQKSRRQATAATVAADITLQGGLLCGIAISAGDCELWTRKKIGFERLMGGDNLYPESRKTWERQLRGREPWKHLDLEQDTIDGPEHRRTDTVGRYRHLRTEIGAFKACRDLVLATDGANFDAWKTSALPLHVWAKP